MFRLRVTVSPSHYVMCAAQVTLLLCDTLTYLLSPPSHSLGKGQGDIVLNPIACAQPGPGRFCNARAPYLSTLLYDTGCALKRRFGSNHPDYI